ncbi:prolyl oligopeptidase family serine peptidase [Streptomyces sp. HSW2009]|uniref:prolyl oligopeptidase family serine peptidase n=1 Tax=Streptomyces sp. HSW2009 TaxID=3142890 RepID=UPI0032EF2A36
MSPGPFPPADRSTPYGSWRSPIDATLAAGHSATPSWPAYVGTDEIWWTEARPELDGRTILMRRDKHGKTQEVLPSRDIKWNIRSRVIEYGGRAWLAIPGTGNTSPTAVFTHYDDQRLYAYTLGEPAPRPLTPATTAPESLRYLLPTPSPDGTAVWCLREHLPDETKPTQVQRSLVEIPLDGSAATSHTAVDTLFADPRQHFLSGPVLSPDKTSVAWFSWNHPDMPWDHTDLHVASIVPGKKLQPVTILTGSSVVQVEWTDATTLVVVSDYLKASTSDHGRWWKLHTLTRKNDTWSTPEPLPGQPEEAEFGGPLWGLGFRWCAPLPDGQIATLYGKGAQRLGILQPRTRGLTPLAGDYTDWTGSLDTRGDHVLGIAGSYDKADAVIEVPLDGGAPRQISESPNYAEIAAYLPQPLDPPLTFTNRNRQPIYATVYPPRHPHPPVPPPGTHPPYILFVHGGPSARASRSLDLTIAYFTSRGIGVAQVDYGGSTGYGRAYRNRLQTQWGVADIQDCEDLALALVEKGLASRKHLAIRGGSAGGFTSAIALTSHGSSHDQVFQAATVMYPVLDLLAFATGTTHDFESRYVSRLVGDPVKNKQTYLQRSPTENTKNIRVPFVILQGLQDPVCPPAQCYEMLTKMMKDRPTTDTPGHAYVGFSGETHGFRKQENIITALEAELALYATAFAFHAYKDAPART